jgi:hypothetical protein
LQVPTLIAKLGEPNGPPLPDVLKAAELRQAFLKGLPLPEPPEPPAIAAPSPARPSPITSSGGAALPIPEQPPPPPPPVESYDGPIGLDGDIRF